MALLLPYADWPNKGDYNAVYALSQFGLFRREDLPWVAIHALEMGREDEVLVYFAGLSPVEARDDDCLSRIDELWNVLPVSAPARQFPRAYVFLHFNDLVVDNPEYWKEVLNLFDRVIDWNDDNVLFIESGNDNNPFDGLKACWLYCEEFGLCDYGFSTLDEIRDHTLNVLIEGSAVISEALAKLDAREPT